MENSETYTELKPKIGSKIRTSVCLLTILLVSFLIILPILLNGIPYGNDLKQHYQFAASIEDALKTGDFFPNWAQNENNGYGGVGLRFYPPIAYYVLTFGKILTGNWYDGSVLAFTFWMFLGGIGIFFWSKEFFSERASLVAAVTYIFVPYHAVELYSSFTYAEFAASGVLPFCFLFVTRICKIPKPLDVLLLALSFAILILTHLPLTLIGSIALAIFVISSAGFNIKKIFYCGLSAVIGLILTSFHWLRIVTEMSWINHSSDTYSSSGTANYDFHEHFLLSFPYLNGLDADKNTLWFIDLCLAITLLICIPSGIIFYKVAETRLRKVMIPIFAVFSVALLMMTKLSLPIWESVSILQKVQFPWRWFSVVSVFAVIFVAAGFEMSLNLLKTTKRSQAFLVFICLIFGIIFTSSQIIRQYTALDRIAFADIIEYVSTAENCDCWLPVWAGKSFAVGSEKVIAEGREVKYVSWSRLEKTIEVSAGEPTDTRFSVLYYPHWKATVNEKSVEVLKTNDGAIYIPTGESAAIIKLELVEPELLTIAILVSKVAWILLILTVSISIWKTSSKSKI
jgi:uncharacterized membrane protein